MNWPQIVLLSAIILVTGERSEDSDLLQGTWKLVHKDVYGKALSFEGSHLTIEKDHFIETETRLVKGTFKLVKTGEIKIIEKNLEAGALEKGTTRGIYQLEDDTFRECLISGESPTLPKEFSSEKGSGRILRTWKRVGRTNDGIVKEDEVTLLGSWKLDSETISGRQSEEDITKGYTFIVESKGRYTIRNESVTKGILRMDESKTPKQIDFEFTYPAILKGKISQRIYRLDWNKLTVEQNSSSEPRPNEFGTNPKTFIHSVYERDGRR